MTHREGVAGAAPPATPWTDTRPGGLARHPDDGWTLAEPMPLGRWTLAAIRGVTDALLPHGEADAPTGAEVRDEVVLGVRRTLRYMAPLSRVGLCGLFVLLDLAPWWTLRAPRRLGGLPPERAAAVLEAVAHAPVGLLRTAVTAVRAAILTTYFDLPAVHRELDYDPVGFMRERIALRQRLLAGGVAGPEDAP